MPSRVSSAVKHASIDEERICDEQLLVGCRQGSAESWDLLVRRYQRLVYSVAMRTGLNAADSADVTQSTFIALLESLDRVRDNERVPAWLATVARRKAWRMLKKFDRERPQSEAPEPPSVEEVAWDEVIDLQQALMTLDNPCRDLLTALYFEPEQPSYAEIAQRFGRAVGGIGPMRGRCLKRIRSMLEANPHG